MQRNWDGAFKLWVWTEGKTKNAEPAAVYAANTKWAIEALQKEKQKEFPNAEFNIVQRQRATEYNSNLSSEMISQTLGKLYLNGLLLPIRQHPPNIFSQLPFFNKINQTLFFCNNNNISFFLRGNLVFSSNLSNQLYQLEPFF